MRRTTVESLTAGTDRLSEMLSPRGQNFGPQSRSRPQSCGLGLGFGLKYLAPTWPRSAAEEPAAKKKSTDQFVCTLPTTGHHTVIEDSYCARERMRN